MDRAVDQAARHELPLRLIHASRWERYEGRPPSFSTERPSAETVAEHIVADRRTGFCWTCRNSRSAGGRRPPPP
ncbi:hypothetical protein AB0B12_09560 [Streptomyces sp. NPDC044780]|uniref:hypothetical protein n=1 Tax=unclassified Streptomyces TaxID=2593676 RepID=UPI0033CF0AD8